MKPLILLQAFVLILLLLFASCKKESNKPLVQNHLPVANAGADISINSTSCSFSHTVELNGSGSYDPDEPNDKIYYEWTKISGPSCDLVDSTSQKPLVTNLSNGQYSFVLKATDVAGLSSNDTVVVNITGSAIPLEVNLDASINSSFVFEHNHQRCEIPFLGWGCYYYDLIKVEGSFDQPGIGQMFLNVNEGTDTFTTSVTHNTQIFLGCTSCVPSQDVSGTCSVNFKKLIQTGGSFSGTLTIETGSAQNNCDENIFTNLTPLSITVSVDTTSHRINLTIKGKVYF